MLQMLQPEEPRRRTSAWLVALVVLVALGGAVALFLVLRPRKAAAKVPENPQIAKLSVGEQTTFDQMTKYAIQGLRMVGFTSGSRTNYATASVPSTGPGVVGGTLSLTSTPTTFSWFPEAPPAGSAGPPAGAGQSFIPGTLSTVLGHGILARTLYLAPDMDTGRVGWSEEKTFVGLYPVDKSKNAFYIAFLSHGPQVAVYGSPHDSGPFTLTSKPVGGYFVAFVYAGPSP